MADDLLPFEAYLFAYVPVPAWPDSVDPAYEPGSAPFDAPPSAEEFFDATRQHFGYLGALGFEIAPADNWERGETLAVPFARDDGVVLVVAAATGGFCVLVTGPVQGDVTPRGVLRELVRGGKAAPIAAFGSFPLLATRGDALAQLVERHARAFLRAVGDLLPDRPLNIEGVASAATAEVKATSRALHASHYRARGAASWAEGRDGATVEAYERLLDLDELRDEERQRLDRAKERLSRRPPSLQRGDEGDRTWIERRAEHVRNKHRALQEAFDARTEAGGIAAWEDAAREFREAVDLMYPPDFWADVRRLQEGHPGAVEPMLVFLEADPWCFRSGYAKETILYLLRRHELTPDQRARVEAVLLRAVDVGDRREFRSSCKLARRFASPALRDALRERLHAEDPDLARRALWMLTALRGPRLEDSDIVRARALILRAARGPDSDDWSVPDWVGHLAWRFWSGDWADELVRVAIDGGPGSEAALRVLSDVPHRLRLEPVQSQRLADQLLHVVQEGEDESWFEGIAPSVDSPELRRALEEAMQQPDGDVRRRAWWALNAMRRAEEQEGRRAGP